MDVVANGMKVGRRFVWVARVSDPLVSTSCRNELPSSDEFTGTEREGKFVAAECGDQRAGGTRYPEPPRTPPRCRSLREEYSADAEYNGRAGARPKGTNHHQHLNR